MKLVIKVGGGADAKARHELAKQIAKLCRSGDQVVLVHGGGKVLTKVLASLGIPTRFEDGLRVTDEEARDVALMVLAGLVNKQWVSALDAQGQRGLGLCGGDGRLVQAQKLAPRGRNCSLGFVGRPTKVRREVLEMAWERGMVPVVASLALNRGGEYLNVNADDLASAIASQVPADRLIYLTESGGVWDAERRLLAQLETSQIPGLIRRGVVRDGMIPKLLSCRRVLAGKVTEVDIVPVDIGARLASFLNGRAAIGTRILKNGSRGTIKRPGLHVAN